MDNIKINEILTSNCITKPFFRGVFSADETPVYNQNKKNIFIFNTSNSFEIGTHWIAILLDKKGTKKKNIYFDSYGLPPSDKRFKKFMNCSFIYNNKPLQHDWSTVCGQWCIYFTFMMSMKKPFSLILNKFSSNPNKFLRNDFLVNKFVNKMFGTKLKVINKQFMRRVLK